MCHKNIEVIRNNYYVSNSIDGEYKRFGAFESLEIAEFVRNHLENNDWDINYFQFNNIFINSHDFWAFVLINDRINFLGIFKDIDLAKKQISKVRENNFVFNNDVVEELYVARNSLRNITVASGIFTLSKNKSLGRFKTEEVALFVRDTLEDNSWDIDYFRENNIFRFSNGEYCLFNVSDEKIKFLGSYSSINSLQNAIKNKKYLSNIPEVSEMTFISYNNGKYELNKFLSQENYCIGRYDSFEVAQFVRDTLIKHSWNMKFFKHNHIFKVSDEKFYLFNLDSGMVEFIGYFTDREGAENKLKQMNNQGHKTKSSQHSKINSKIDGEKFIKHTRGKYVIIKDSKTYGSFSSLDLAVAVVKTLRRNNWDVDYFSKGQILEIDFDYGVFKKEGNLIEFLDLFDSELDAKLFLENYVTYFNADVFKYDGPVKLSFNLDDVDDAFIYRDQNGSYGVEKEVDGVRTTFGFFDNLKTARILKEILEMNDWDIDYFKKNFIFEIENLFYIFVLNENGEVICPGTYDNKLDAENKLGISCVVKDNGVHNEKSKNNDMKNINKSGNFYYVQKIKQGVRTVYGKYASKTEAIIVRNILRDANWNINYFKSNEVIFKFHIWRYAFIFEDDMVVCLGKFKNKRLALEAIKNRNINKEKDDLKSKNEDLSGVSESNIIKNKSNNDELVNELKGSSGSLPVLNKEIGLNIYQNGDDFKVKQADNVIAIFKSSYIAFVFRDILWDNDKDMLIFNKFNIFNHGLDFYIFKQSGGNVKFLNQFEFYSEALNWIDYYNQDKNEDEKLNNELLKVNKSRAFKNR